MSSFPEKFPVDSIGCRDNCTCNTAQSRVIHYCATREHCCVFPSFQDISRSIAIVDIILAFGIAAVELVFTALPNSYIQIYNVYNMRGEIITEQYAHQPSTFLTIAILCMFFLIFEGWLFDILMKGAIERDCKELNRWLNARVIFLVINTMMTVYRYVDLQFCLYDLTYIPVAMYRILEIVFVKGLITELKDTSSQLSV